MTRNRLGISTDMEVVRFRGERAETVLQPIAAEVPCTLIANDIEIGTLLCSPQNLKELAIGFLFTSAFIKGIEDVKEIHIDNIRWSVHCDIASEPDPQMLSKRMYTSGCGKGIVFANITETGLRMPLRSSLRISAAQVKELAAWLQHCSPLHGQTGGIHTAAISCGGAIPELYMDDIGRHNAVDKIIGTALQSPSGFSDAVLISSGRVSSEILLKARHAGIAIILSRGAPTHQSVLKARAMEITLVGFARSSGFTIYSCPERITP